MALNLIRSSLLAGKASVGVCIMAKFCLIAFNR